MEGNYYDIDDILAESKVLPCRFLVDAVELGYLDDTEECGDDLKQGIVINLPFFLIKQLYKRRMIDVERPIYYQTRFGESLMVDPKVMNLRAKCEYWYVLGWKLCKLMEAKEIATWMEKSLQSRNEEIIDQSSHYKSGKCDHFKSTLTYIEQKLFDQKHETENYMHRW
eukprot:CAMPEP_0202686780 /NCGR_PEP_ID=MMETSP1385-20130828/2547_1 /ASSEMBLY_ACC=CAM_ASM_000861 /TAXON_ID=933848 /ORGANISM="Elphidium margaritaceum" /LENGTH=167 /DNA_ID=CAMNT_0049341431 /DNA_START=58 /DNA_END=558 /DNA_ORIENTATION=-